MTDAKTLDCRGLACPQPVINTKDALHSATSPLLVIVDNEAACSNVSRVAASHGSQVAVTRRDSEYHLTLTPGTAAASPAEATSAANLVVYVSSEAMGRGDDQLGAILMAAFLDTLSQFKGTISHAIFINSGAKLTVQGSPVLEQVRQLEELGVQILICGTCLNYFGIADQLAVGSVSNMYAIIETLAQAGRIIRP